MNMPAHPRHTDDAPANSQPRRRVVIAAISVVILLAGIHLLRTTLG